MGDDHMTTDNQMLRELRAEVGALRVAVIAISEKSSPEVRSEFASRISSALDGNERDAENPDAALMTEAAANLIVRVMPDFRAQDH
jgi:flagellar biosynthesis regulator FlaF